MAQRCDGVRDVECPVIVGVTGIFAGGVAFTEEERAQGKHGIGDIKSAVVVAVASEELRTATAGFGVKSEVRHASVQAEGVTDQVVGVSISVQVFALGALGDLK